MRALILSLAAVLMLSPLGAAQKKPAASKTKTTAKTSSKSSSSKSTKTQAKANTKTSKAKSSKKVASARVSQQHPTAERYTEIQQALVSRGYLQEANGVWDAQSVSALKKFQQDQELPTDGKLGALSLTALGLGPRRGAFVVAPEVPVTSAAIAAD